MLYRLVLYIILLSFTFITQNSFAQNKLVLCNKYDKNGTFSNAYETWSIQKSGNFIYVLYQSDTIAADTLFISLQKTVGRRDTNYYNYDNYYLVTDTSKKFAVNKFIFTDAGKYKISAYYRNSKEPLASHFTTVTFNYEEYANSLFYDTWYYNKSTVTFCDSINSKKEPIGISKIFNYKPTGNIITVYISQPEELTLRTDLLYVKVYAIDLNNKLILTHTYFISRAWHWTFVPIKLTEKGNYLVEVYDENEVFINSNTVEIK